METNNNYDEFGSTANLKAELIRYFTFWPWFLLSCFIFVISAFIFLRYTDYKYKTTSKIEIIDEAQDSEMALPTSLTVFNRSMINLENETGILTSYSLHSNVVKDLNSNVRFYTSGQIISSETHRDDSCSGRITMRVVVPLLYH